MKIGYARVSAKWYQMEVQLAALRQAGCERIWKGEPFAEEYDSARFLKLLGKLNAGDTLVTNRLSCIARSSSELLVVLKTVRDKGAILRSLEEPWADTTRVPIERLIEIVEGLNEFSIELKKLGDAGGDRRPAVFGVTTGRPQKLTELQKLEARSMLRLGKTAAEVGRIFNVSRSTISRLKQG